MRMQGPHGTYPSILPSQHFSQQQTHNQLFQKNLSFNNDKKFDEEDQKQSNIINPKDDDDDSKMTPNRTNHKVNSDEDTDPEDIDDQKKKITTDTYSSNNNSLVSNKNDVEYTQNENKNEKMNKDDYEFNSENEVEVSSLEEEDQNNDFDKGFVDNNNDNGDSDCKNHNSDLIPNSNETNEEMHKPQKQKRKRISGSQMKVLTDNDKKEDEKESKKVKENDSEEATEEIKVQKPLGLLAQHGITPGSKNQISSPFYHQQHLQMQQFQQHRQQLIMQHQQQFNAFFNSGNRKHKLFGPEVRNEPFPLMPVKNENSATQNGAIYPEWTAYSDNKNNKHENKNGKTDKDDGEKDTENTNDSSEIDESNGLVDLSRQLLLTDQRFMPSPPPSNFPIPSPSSPNSKSENSGHHWTFEEQFKQLYEMSLDPKRKDFLDDLFSFMQKRGTPVNRIPIMAKQTLDLYELFRLVISKGGLVEVINKKLWREITKGLNLPSSITSAAFTLRTQYMKYLYPYECEKLKLSSLSELQSAIDGNRREGRRPGFDFPNFPPLLPPTPSAPHLANLLGPMPLRHNNTSPSSRQPPIHVQDDRPRMGVPTNSHFMPGHSLQQLQQLHHMGTPFRPFLSEHEARMMHEAAARAMEEMAKRVEESARQQKHHLQHLQQHAMQQHSSTPDNRRSVLTPQHQEKVYDADAHNNVKADKKENHENDGRSSNNSNVSRNSEHNNDKNDTEKIKNSEKQTKNFSRIKISSRKDDKAEGKENTLSVCMEVDGVIYEGMLFASPSTQ